MTGLRPRKPSASMIVAIIALVAALGGTSYAAISLPKNSVGSKQLKKNAVTTAKIKNHAVTAGKINPAGLTVPNATHAASADNAATANGNTVNHVSLEMGTNTTATVFSGDGLTLTAVCDASTHVGFNAQSTDSTAELNASGLYSKAYDGTGTTLLALVPPGTYEGNEFITYGSTSGHSVAVELGTDYDNAFNTGTNTHCGVWGTVIAG